MVLGIFAILSIITGMVYNPRNGWIEGVSILIAIFAVVLISAISDWHKDSQFVALSSLASDENLPVIRGKHGQMETVNIWDLCVGDVVLLNAGDRVPADCIIINSSRVVTNEEACFSRKTEEIKQTNETRVNGKVQSHPKSKENPFLYADAYLTEGSCSAVVTCVGVHSTRGDKQPKIDTNSETALQTKLWNLSKTFTFIGIWSAIVILITAVVIQCIETGVND